MKTLGMWGVGLAILLGAEAASACRGFGELELANIKQADVVVVGRVMDYQIIEDPLIRERHKKRLERDPEGASELTKILSGQRKFTSDYARFTVLVDEVLLGEPGPSIVVAWNNATFGEPETMDEGPYLIGLRELDGSRRDLMHGDLEMLQVGCTRAFLLRASGPEADAAREFLRAEER